MPGHEVAAIIADYARDGALLRERFFAENDDAVIDAGRILAVSLAQGGKILLCGNGGSAADSQHLAAEFVNRFLLERPPLPAVALSTDTSILTAVGNDYGFDLVFAKQIKALGKPGDVLLAFSTSGSSPNVIQALKSAKEKGVASIALTGKGGGECGRLADHLLAVDSTVTPLIQEIHIAVGHVLCRLVDHYLFEAVMDLKPFLDVREP